MTDSTDPDGDPTTRESTEPTTGPTAPTSTVESDGSPPGEVVDAEANGHDTYRMVFEASDPVRVIEALEAVADVDGGPSVREVRSGSGETATVPLAELTDKQQQTIVRAVELGYYDTPRQASLDDLREGLGISRSAASQRLRKAESTIVRRVAEEIGLEADASES